MGWGFPGLPAIRNLPLIWLTLMVLKLIHEFGHACACKVFGGDVPEMGAYLIFSATPEPIMARTLRTAHRFVQKFLGSH